MNRIDLELHLPTRVTIIGAARSGIAAARYFTEKKCSVFISDMCSAGTLNKILERNNLQNIDHESGGHTKKALATDLIVVSPGVPSDIPVLAEAKNSGIPVWSEMELGYRASKAPFFAVTGSTGKSTTVSLAGAVLAAAGREHVVAGNIGLPVISSTPAVSERGIVIAEVSSFQLETIDAFHPHVAVIVNLMKNHLDRYTCEEDYYNAKKEIVRNMTANDYLIVNALDARLLSWGMSLRNRIRLVCFGADISGCDSFFVDGTLLRYRFDGMTGVLGDASAMKLKGIHNYHNASVAAALGKIAGVADAVIMEGLCSFSGLAHRLEFVGSADGISWYNDSKSTTAESMVCAIEAFPRGVHLIAGGKDKGCDFSVVTGAIRNHSKDIILIGEAADRMEAQWKGIVPIFRAATLHKAILNARAHAVPGDVVVFSPGCSSFDMFRDYEDRGDQFRAQVQALIAGTERL